MHFPLQCSQPLALPPLQRHSPHGRLQLLARNRYQIAGACLVAVLLPALIGGELEASRLRVGSAEKTAVATFTAVLAAAYLFRHLTAFPGVPRYSCMVAALLATHATIITVMSTLNIDYSQPQFVASCLATVAWYMFVLRLEWPMRRPFLLVVPGGDAHGLREITDADWSTAPSPGEVPDLITGVVADLRADIGPSWEAFLARCAEKGLPIYHSKQVRELLTGRVSIEHLSENTFSSILPASKYMQIKRIFDIVGVVVAAPLVVPIAFSTALLIKLIDGGPVLFCQTRMGFRGQPFTIYKFRTMHPEVGSGLAFTEQGDQRISRLGQVLRHYRVDELPQIVNVLKGEMSWIGPRPESVPLSEWYDQSIPFYSYRHIVRPGITGWAQINQGNVAMLEAATIKLHYDFYYIKHFSPWIDMLIAVKTIPVILTGQGAR